MNKQKVNMTSSMKEKGYSSSSHYRISSEFEQSEQALATKFVHWDVPPLESLCDSSVYQLRAKLNRGERMSFIRLGIGIVLFLQKDLTTLATSFR